ncbi:MAG TPA: hypothetical protein VFV92_03305 [Candidatus Bathyarchaeia archaeon]|nr:hypothetical protein [Candidatus Bathyarchaeia archaeon]
MAPFPRFHGVDIHKIVRNHRHNTFELYDAHDNKVCEIDDLAYQQHPIFKHMPLESIHGKNRRTSATPHSDPAGEPSAGVGPGRAPAFRPGSFGPIVPGGLTFVPSPVPRPGPGPVNRFATLWAMPSDLGDYGPRVQEFHNLWVGPVVWGKESKNVKMPHTNTFGEIEAFRFWLVTEDLLLMSYTQNCMWPPNTVMPRSDPTKQLYLGTEPASAPLGYYAFKNEADCRAEAPMFEMLGRRMGLDYPWTEVQQEWRPEENVKIDTPVKCIGMGYGTVQLWGEVIEHEIGYRAEYAKVKSLDGVFLITRFQDMEETLRRKYARPDGR